MAEGPKVYDITRRVAPTTAVWPGDTPFTARWTARLDRGDTVNLATVELSTHAGTHADAPLHYARDGAPVDSVPLLHFVGPCTVVHIEEVRPIRRDDVAGIDLDRPGRVLFRTPHSLLPDDAWSDAFAVLEPGLAAHLAARGVVLVGTDAPSVDPVDSTTLDAHHALGAHGIVNLENLLLRGVPPGRYELIALPMRLVGLDAAPVRAILRTLPS